jgi:signal transduction histidine kinase
METLNFKTNIQLKSIIGKDLINDDNIAILELVKNSFDAGAKKVEVIYSNLKENDDKTVKTFSDKTSRLFIKDDGLGMDLDDIKNKWLNIAYSDKKKNTRQNNRMMAGAKGVGRFSCDRLGEYLNLYAKTKNANEYILLKIDWKQFEIEDNKKEIQSIDLVYEYLSIEDLIDRNIPVFEQGVLLEIIKLRSKWIYEIKDKKGNFSGWNTEKFLSLKQYLEKLINPNQAFVESNDFGIYLEVPEFTTENNKKEQHNRFIGKIENTIFGKLDFKTTSIEAEIIDNGKTIFTTLKDKGQTIFWIKEKNEFYPYLKDIKIYLFYLNPFAKAFFTKQTGFRSVDYGSIYLFTNGFRVPPYGENGNDWLGLEQRKGQGYARFLGLRDLVGRIEILDSDSRFQIVSSREGIIMNDSYKQLTDRDGFFFKSFRRLEKYVVDGLSWDSIPANLNMGEIEKKIISGQIKENDLIFRETDLIKRRRIYESIHSIISAKADNVDELYINEDLILDKIQEEKENARREFEQLITDFENKKIDADTLNRILQKKALENKDLEKQINEFSKYATNEVTTKAIAELQYYKETIDKQTKIIEKLKFQLDQEREEKEKQALELANEIKKKEEAQAQLDKEILERKSIEIELDIERRKRKNAEKETQFQKSELEIERKKNTYLLSKRRLNDDVEGLIHHISIWNGKSKSKVDKLIRVLREKGYWDKNIEKDFSELNLFVEKTSTIANLITRAGFKKDEDKQSINVCDYFEQYINIYHQIYSSELSKSIKVTFISNGLSIYKNISPLELSIIIDNLVSNSLKWEAKNIVFEAIDIDKKALKIIAYDDGLGLATKFLANPKQIFELGITESSGSGIGLYFVNNIMTNKENINGSIVFLGNNIKLKGACFELTFN